MPLPNQNGELHYSFDYGPFHFVSLNVEVYYKHGGHLGNVTSMYHWLIKNLADVKRNITPWVIIFGHRPMYCAMGWWDCASNTTRTQIGKIQDVILNLRYQSQSEVVKVMLLQTCKTTVLHIK